MRWWTTWRLGFLVALPAVVGAQEGPEDLVRERAEFVAWLRTAITSPFRAVVQHPIGPGISAGPPQSDVPLTGVPPVKLEERGRGLLLTVDGSPKPIARDRPLSLGTHWLLVGGPPGRSVATFYGSTAKPVRSPAHHRYRPALRFTVALTPAASPKSQRMLSPDGTEVEATEAGSVTVLVGNRPATLRVFRIPGPGGEESELEIYFRDGTNSRTTYPAGRFVNLTPTADGRYLLDFNRARNPFCAYSTVYPCPAPWRGNTISVPVDAGETYQGGGLDPKLPPNS